MFSVMLASEEQMLEKMFASWIMVSILCLEPLAVFLVPIILLLLKELRIYSIFCQT